MREITISTINEFVSAVLDVRAEWYPKDPYPEVWYRGINDDELPLLPGAYWRSHCDETSLVLSFRAMAPLLVPRTPEDDWDWYILMQHYRLPTRLLDWTENPLQALHFAITDVAVGKAPCVWILDPLALNYSMHGHEFVYVPAGQPRDSDFAAWLPPACGRGHAPTPAAGMFADNSKPIAIFPVRNNPRILAQRGVFTVHGTDEKPLEQLPLKDPSGRDGVARILVNTTKRLTLLDDLWTLGHTKTSTYPEADSISEDLKRLYRVQ